MTIYENFLDKIDEKQDEIEDRLGDGFGVVLGAKQMFELRQHGPSRKIVESEPMLNEAYGRLGELWLFLDGDEKEIPIQIKEVKEINSQN